MHWMPFCVFIHENTAVYRVYIKQDYVSFQKLRFFESQSHSAKKGKLTHACEHNPALCGKSSQNLLFAIFSAVRRTQAPENHRSCTHATSHSNSKVTSLTKLLKVDMHARIFCCLNQTLYNRKRSACNVSR